MAYQHEDSFCKGTAHIVINFLWSLHTTKLTQHLTKLALLFKYMLQGSILLQQTKVLFIQNNTINKANRIFVNTDRGISKANISIVNAEADM